MKKRLLAMLLCVCMVAVLLPMVAFAAGTDAIQLGTGGISGYDSTNGYDYIYYGTYGSAPVQWRVLDDQTNTGAAGLFMLSEDCMGTGGNGDVYFNNTDPFSNAWQGSFAQYWCSNFFLSTLAPGERGAILATSKNDEAYTSTSTSSTPFAASNNILNSDKVFFLSAKEVETAAYGFSGDNSRIANYNGSAGVWLLRSPFATTTEHEGAVGKSGNVFGTHVLYDFSARPAFNLNLSSVLFTSAAEGGKASGTVGAGALLPNAASASPHYYKLTLKDSNRSFDVAEATAVGHSGGNITLHCANLFQNEPADYTNEYISGMITDGDGNVLYYGNLAAVTQQTVSDAALTVTIPAALAAGSYTLKLFSEECNGDKKTDYASTFSDVALTVDNTAPTVEIISTVSGVTNASAIPITLTFSKSVTGFDSSDLSVGNGTAGSFSGSGMTYTAQITPAAEGTVTVDIAAGSAQDAAGNSNTDATRFSIIYDKTAPTVTGVTDGSSYNTTIKPTFTEDTATLAKDSGTAGAYTSGTDISAEGSYVLKVTDAAGNCTTISFNIDKTAPATTGVTNGSYYNTSVKPTFTEGTATLAKDSGTAEGYTSGTDISAEGSYVLKVTDAAGNCTTISFNIDKTAPATTGVTNGSYYNTSVKPTFTEGTATLAKDSGTAEGYTSGTDISAEGSYVLKVTDAAGNCTTISFSIDKTAPAVSGVTNGSSYNTSVKPTFTEGTATLAKDSGTAQGYTSGTEISDEGSYVLKVTDAAGNYTTISFSIDKTAPAVTSMTDGSSYNTSVKPTFTEGTATLAKDSGTAGAYTSGTEISDEGSYVLKVTDAAGNYTTISFSIDKTAPIVSGVTNGSSYNTSVKSTFNEGTATLAKDSTAAGVYTSGTEVSAEGSYVLKVTDAAGNCTTISFSINKPAL